MELKLSLHGHGPNSHGRNIYYESEVTTRDKLQRPRMEGWIDSTSDHNTTEGLLEMKDEMKYRNVDYPHISQIEVSTPGHVIITGPYGVVKGIERKDSLDTVGLERKNKADLKKKEYGGVTDRILELFDKVRSSDKTAITLPHPFDTLKSGVVSKYPVEEALKIIKEVDYLEIYNGMNSEKGNYYNATLGIIAKEKYGTGMVVGSDYHTSKMMGTNLNIIDAENDDETSILKAIQNKKVVGYDNLESNSRAELKRWAVNRGATSKKDIINRTYTKEWGSDEWWVNVANWRVCSKMIRGTVRYADKNPNSKWWDLVAGVVALGVYMGEVLEITPKYKKMIKEIYKNGIDSYGPLSYGEFRNDPLEALEKIAVVPGNSHHCH